MVGGSRVGNYSGLTRRIESAYINDVPFTEGPHLLPTPYQARQLAVVPHAEAPRISAAVAASIVVPAIVTDAGDQAPKRERHV